MKESREYTDEEVQEKLIKHFWLVLDYWMYQSNADTTREKMEGMLFTILSSLDGSSVSIPGFKIIANTHEDDKQYHIGLGVNYYNDKRDIGGYLHELLGQYGPTDEEKAKKELLYKRERKLNRISNEK